MYRIEYSELARRQLEGIISETDRNAVGRRIGEIRRAPFRTRALKHGLEPYRRAKAAGHYRIFFTVDENSAVVHTAYIGIRAPDQVQDAYATFLRLMQDKGADRTEYPDA